MKHGVLVTAYTNFDHLVDLIEFFDEDFYLFIHIDRKAKIPATVLKQLQQHPRVILLSRKYVVNWGSLAHLRCILFLLSEACKKEDITYFHLLSGHDFPIKSIKEIKQRFSAESHSFLEWFEVDASQWKDEWHRRLSYYGLYDVVNVKYRFGRKLNNAAIWLQKKMGFKRRSDSTLATLYGGMTWWSLHRSCVEYILKYVADDHVFLKQLKFTFCPEEIYIPTILMNSPLRSTVINNDLRFIDWTYRNGNSPANLDESDVTALIESGDLFARRFESEISEKLKLMLKAQVLKH